MVNEKLIYLTTHDNIKFALWKIYHNEKSVKNIFLTHGTFSDKKICLAITTYFVKKGFNCWIMEWRNHGSSDFTKMPFNFETIALQEITITFNYLINELKIRHLHCITHSGGGISLTMFLIKNPNFQKYIKSISLFSCQSYSAAYSVSQKIKIYISKYLTYIVGYVPAKILKLGVHNESYFTMKQWYNWNLKNNFYGTDKFNYLDKMKTIKIPIYSLCSENDNFISPKTSCKKYLDNFENSKNKYQCFSKENGNFENYGHSRIIFSRNSMKEVWKLVEEWINKNE